MPRHSRLGGSRDIERWVQQAATGLQSTYRENVLKPLRALQAELFKTFRSALAAAVAASCRSGFVLPHACSTPYCAFKSTWSLQQGCFVH